jgi:hypothetical protein
MPSPNKKASYGFVRCCSVLVCRYAANSAGLQGPPHQFCGPGLTRPHVHVYHSELELQLQPAPPWLRNSSSAAYRLRNCSSCTASHPRVTMDCKIQKVNVHHKSLCAGKRPPGFLNIHNTCNLRLGDVRHSLALAYCVKVKASSPCASKKVKASSPCASQQACTGIGALAKRTTGSHVSCSTVEPSTFMGNGGSYVLTLPFVQGLHTTINSDLDLELGRSVIVEH